MLFCRLGIFCRFKAAKHPYKINLPLHLHLFRVRLTEELHRHLPVEILATAEAPKVTQLKPLLLPKPRRQLWTPALASAWQDAVKGFPVWKRDLPPRAGPRKAVWRFWIF
jgi:hypothetical protein